MIENACKYSDKYTARVTISIRPETKIIRIKDEGIGMTPEEAEKIFGPFYPSPKAEQISDGLGLGLSMSSRIIRLDSQQGKGSVFTITFPPL